MVQLDSTRFSSNKVLPCMQVAFEEGKLQNESIEEPGNMNNTRTVLVSRDLDMKGRDDLAISSQVQGTQPHTQPQCMDAVLPDS